jgi:peptide/nickel transport system permease protein
MILTLIAKRLLIAIPTLLALTFVVFLMVKAVPGDPAQILLGERASAEALETLRHEMGLDRPLLVQYGLFLKKLLLEFDLGRSVATNESISEVIGHKFPATIELAVAGMLFAIIIGIPTGLLAAIWPATLVDFASMTVATVGVSMPIFWLALVLTWIFGLELGIFPMSGRLGVDFYYEPVTGFVFIDSILARDWSMLSDGIMHIVLPAVALGTIPMAFLARITRASMLEVIKQDYVRTAKSKGVSVWLIYCKHALKNAFIPILTVLGLQFGVLLGGAIITETIFSWPGIGSWLLESVNSRDYTALEGGILVTASAFVIVNMVVDLLYRVFDPRMRLS